MQHDHYHSLHYRFERLMRHRLLMIVVLGLMSVATLTALKMDSRFASVVERAYNEGFGWIGTYMHHEHPAHSSIHVSVAKLPTISGSGS